MALRSVSHPQSGNIVSVSYDDESMSLFIEFKGQRVYRYFPVPADTALGFEQALSANDYFTMTIRGLFEYEHMS